mgnify:CR=1 FL=1
MKHALKVAENWAEYHAKHANDLIAIGHRRVIFCSR